jgi:hypothetical protein
MSDQPAPPTGPAFRRGRPPEQTEHRGVSWYRDERGRVSFYDAEGERWVPWRPGVDAPPRPPGWGNGEVVRPRWRSGWRVVPIVLTVAVVAIAVDQALQPSSNNGATEAKASAALLGKCLSQSGTALGHAKYSSQPVSCSSPRAAMKVVDVLPSTPGSPLCPAGTTGVELPYAGVRYLDIECLQPAPRR